MCSGPASAGSKPPEKRTTELVYGRGALAGAGPAGEFHGNRFTEEARVEPGQTARQHLPIAVNIGRLAQINEDLARALRMLEAMIDRAYGCGTADSVGHERVQEREPQTLAELLDQRVNTTAVLVQLLHRQIERANTIA